MPAQRHLPSTVFVTDHLAEHERFDAWRQSISVVFDVAPLAHAGTEAFKASVEATHLGSLLVGDLHFGGQQFSRSRPRVVRDGMDHYLVQWYRRGGFVGQADDGQDLVVQASDIVLFDLSRTQRTFARPSHVLSLVLPREVVDDALGSAGSWHGTVLRANSIFGGLLADHLASMHRRLPSVTMQDAPAVACATVQMIAACVDPSLRNLSHARDELNNVTLDRVQQFIARHLAQPLTPGMLCNQFGMSRSLLYRLFEPLGGVASYIQQRRLLRAFHALSNPLNRRLRVTEIAARVGFVSAAHFSRAFHVAFGVTPSDVRAMALAAVQSHDGHSPPLLTSSIEFADWMRSLHT